MKEKEEAALERLKALTRQIVAVPKVEIEARAKAYADASAKKRRNK